MRKTTIDIKTLFQVFKKNWAIIIASAIILMMGAVIYANTLVTPMFTSQIDVMIDNRLSNEVNPTVGEVTSSQQLTATYMTVMENEQVVLKKVQEAMNGKYTVGQIKSMIKLSQVNDSMIIRIKATTPLPEDSSSICDAIAKFGEAEIETTLNIDNINILGSASTPLAPSSPNVTMYGLVGAVLGFAISYVIVFVLALRDNTIKDKHSVKEHFDLPFFGEIPSFNTNSRGYKKYGRYGKYGRYSRNYEQYAAKQ